jgi:hypothetical protein
MVRLLSTASCRPLKEGARRIPMAHGGSGGSRAVAAVIGRRLARTPHLAVCGCAYENILATLSGRSARERTRLTDARL